MDVQCERCKTEYEFDDALVSGRGTTVKCTNCGFQFKVHKQTGEVVDDRWIVRTSDGKELVFHALKDLQKAIIAKQVGRHDTLARGGGPPRPLGAIAELAPFFEEQRKRASSIPPPPPPAPPPLPRRASVSQANDRGGTVLGGLGAPAQAAARRADPEPTPKRISSRPPAPAPAPAPRRERMDTLRPDSTGTPPPPAAATLGPAQSAPRIAAAAPAPNNKPRAADENVLHMPATSPLAQTGIVAPPEVSSPLPAPTAPVRRPSYDEEASDAVRGPMRAELDSVLPMHRGGVRVGGWVIALALIACVGLLGVIVARPYFAAQNTPKPPPSAQLDPRAQDFLRIGERALDEGDLDTAKENLDKASVIAEKDPRVLLDLARLSTVRADVPWMRQRIAPQDAADETKRALTDLSARAKVAAEVALAAAPEDSAAIRVKIDALRIAGDRDQARALVTKIILNAQQPETSYVLAALDLAEPEPLWKSIVERLHIAAQAEGGLGRARAALVYALARSGDTAGAKAELDRLGQLARPHPLYAPLKALVDKTPQAKPDGGSVAAVDVNSLPRPAGGGGGGGGSDVPAGDAKSLVIQANNAYARRDYQRAEHLYAAALDKNPGDSEAQAGLGDVARAQHNLHGARASYAKAVAINSHYLPALVGLADVEWEMGDRASATKRYKDMLDNFPEGALPSHVRSRAEAGSQPAPPSTDSAPSTGGQ
jgi:predicted Zn finger-like uncharacterized protein